MTTTATLFTDKALAKAHALVDAGTIVNARAYHTFFVPGSDGVVHYRVTIDYDGPRAVTANCTCPHGQHRSRPDLPAANPSRLRSDPRVPSVAERFTRLAVVGAAAGAGVGHHPVRRSSGVVSQGVHSRDLPSISSRFAARSWADGCRDITPGCSSV